MRPLCEIHNMLKLDGPSGLSWKATMEMIFVCRRKLVDHVLEDIPLSPSTHEYFHLIGLCRLSFFILSKILFHLPFLFKFCVISISISGSRFLFHRLVPQAPAVSAISLQSCGDLCHDVDQHAGKCRISRSRDLLRRLASVRHHTS